MASASDCIHQAAAIPVRGGRVCLVTSSSGNRWVVPKGHFEPDKTAAQIALQEAWEEAGLIGVMRPEPVGSYVYSKFSNTLPRDRLRHGSDRGGRGLARVRRAAPAGLG